MSESVHIPFVEILKSIPAVFGIRLDAEPKYEVVDTLGDARRSFGPS